MRKGRRARWAGMMAAWVSVAVLAACGDSQVTAPEEEEDGFVEVAAGAAHACALDGSGAAWCWGASPRGPVGTRAESVLRPVAVPGGYAFRTLAAGGESTCGITLDDRLLCWGSNQMGQLGGGALDSFVPAEVDPDLRWRSVSVGAYHMCGVDAERRLRCWGGDRWDAALGYLASGRCTSPFANPGWPCSASTREPSFGGTWDWVEAGLYQTCAGRSGEAARCWGTNLTGQLGTTTPEPCAGPDPVHPESRPCSRTPVLPDGPALERIDPGATHACGLTSGDELWCWGGLGLDFGQVGTGSDGGAAAPVRVAADRTFQGVWASEENQINTFSCAVDAGGAALCWGANRWGQTGQEGTGRCGPSQALCTPVPTPVSGGHAFLQLSVGSEFACGLTVQREVLCWGLNDRGQLGDGGTTTRAEPAPVLF